MFICKDHVLTGINDLHVPLIRRTEKKVRCKYCNLLSIYELYYFDFDYLSKPIKKEFYRIYSYSKKNSPNNLAGCSSEIVLSND